MNYKFRVIISQNVDKLLKLSKDINDKHILDGVSSPLKGLNMTGMAASLAIAKTKHDESEQASIDKETALQNRNLALGLDESQFSFTPNTVLFYVTSIRDFLLGVNKGTERNIGNWGFVVNNKTKGEVTVIIPRNATKLLKLANKIKAKHTADGATSILEAFDMTDFSSLIAAAEAQIVLFDGLKTIKEKAVQDRNLAMGKAKGQSTKTIGTLGNYIRGVRDTLKGLYKGREQTLADWGFEVLNGSTPPPTDPSPYTISGLVNDASTLAPIGAANLVFATSIGPMIANTNPLGEYSLDVLITAEETANVSINAPGYLPFAQVVTLTPEGNATFNFALTAV